MLTKQNTKMLCVCVAPRTMYANASCDGARPPTMPCRSIISVEIYYLRTQIETERSDIFSKMFLVLRRFLFNYLKLY